MNLIQANFSCYEHLLATAPLMKQICNPLFKIGIFHFCYKKIFEDGSYIALDSDVNLTKTYLENIKNVGGFFTKALSNLEKNKYHYLLIPNDIKRFGKQKEPIFHLLYDFNVWNLLIIARLDPKGFLECYNFALSRNEDFGAEFYLTNSYILEHFIDYFSEKASNLTNGEDKRKLGYLDQEFNFQNTFKKQILTQQIEQFLKETKLKFTFLKTDNQNIKLAPREAECLRYLALGYSIKEIGKKLGLSPRTIEFYLHRTKQKTNSPSREELIVKFIQCSKTL